MILREQMQKFGWSNELIEAVEQISANIGLRDLDSVKSLEESFSAIQPSSSSSINVTDSSPVGWNQIPVQKTIKAKVK